MKIAIVGSGISGLAAGVILNPHHEVHLFEADSRLGGHANTVLAPSEDGDIPIDTGFLVYNTLTYPHFTRFLEYLDVKTVASDMSLSIQSETGMEWAGTNLSTVFAQRKNLFNVKFLRMLKNILDFNENAEKNLKLSKENQWSLGELVMHLKLSPQFLSWYLLPMTGAIWSMSYSMALRFPAETFLTFCMNHHLLQVNQRPVWRTIEGGSIRYVERAQKRIANIHLNSPVTALIRNGEKIIVHTPTMTATFDKVILATHAPISRKLLTNEFSDIAQVLAPLTTSKNRVDLHKDESVMPKRRKVWSSWNVNANEKTDDESDIRLSYYLNKLQPLKSKTNYFVTLNSKKKLGTVINTFNYDHPQFDFAAINAQKELPQVQGRHGIYLAGAWTRYGFHEDGILSAVTVARLLGCEPPWD